MSCTTDEDSTNPDSTTDEDFTVPTPYPTDEDSTSDHIHSTTPVDAQDWQWDFLGNVKSE